MRRRHFLTTLLAPVCVMLSACTSEEQQSAPSKPPLRVVKIAMAVPPEARDVAQEVAEAFNLASAKSQGEVRVALEIREGGSLSTGLRIAEGKTSLGLWLAPSSLAVAVANRRGEPAGVRLEQCASVMSTQAAVVYRTSDAFQLKELPRPLNLEELYMRLSLHEKGALQPPVLVGGAPQLSTSGFAGLLLTAAIASKSAVGHLTSESVMTHDAMRKRTELLSPFVHYFTSDRHMLSWLQGLDGGRAVLALSTTQELERPGVGSKGLLEALPIDAPALALDYPLCSVGSPYQKELDREAVRVIQKFFLSDHVQEIVKRHGFKTRVDLLETPSPAMVDAIESLLADWPVRKSPTGLTVVLDTSTGVKGSLLTTLSKYIVQIARDIPGNRGINGLITCAQTPEKVIVAGGAGSVLDEAVKGFHASGGLALRDCLLEALQLAAFNTATTGVAQRREIVAFITSDDTSSQMPLERFLQVASQLTRQSRPGIHVIGVGQTIEQFGRVPQLVHDLGGRFLLAPQGEPLANVVAQVSQVIE